MLFLAIAYLGGALTVFSPCIFPILPFVFARAEGSFARSTLPMLAGMALTFTLVASLATVGGAWAIHANEIGRYTALAVLIGFGIALLSPRLSAHLTGPVFSLGERLANANAVADRPAHPGTSFILGVATGLLWTPCTGPILGLVLTGAAVKGANVHSTFLLLAYAAGAATALAAALLVGSRVFAALKRYLGVGEWIRRVLGAGVILGATTLAFGADTAIFSRLTASNTDGLERAVLDASKVKVAAAGAAGQYRSRLPVEGKAPGFDGAVEWLNAAPLSADQLRGKVVLVDFWTYSCINCIRTLPYIRAWAEKYKDQGLVVVGVHAPEFAFEKKIDNVKKAVSDFKINFPVAIDNNFRIWRAFDNSAWPAYYLIDSTGHIRYHQFGEGQYDVSEKAIQDLLAEAGNKTAKADLVTPDAPGPQAAPDLRHIRSGETYVGYRQASGFISRGGAKANVAAEYQGGQASLNEWALNGNWTVKGEQAALNRAGGGITYRFSARDLHLVMGPGPDGKPIRFQVTVDGQAPQADHGADIDVAGNGTAAQTRLYQLVRQSGEVKERTFEIRFLDAGAQAYAFTFG